MGVESKGPHIIHGFMFHILNCRGRVVFFDQNKLTEDIPFMDIAPLPFTPLPSSPTKSTKSMKSSSTTLTSHESNSSMMKIQSGRQYIVHLLLRPGHYDLLYPMDTYFPDRSATIGEDLIRRSQLTPRTPSHHVKGKLNVSSVDFDTIPEDVDLTPSPSDAGHMFHFQSYSSPSAVSPPATTHDDIDDQVDVVDSNNKGCFSGLQALFGLRFLN